MNLMKLYNLRVDNVQKTCYNDCIENLRAIW